jgi:hypothetical protein
MKHFVLIMLAFFITLAGKSQQTPSHTVDNANYKIEYQNLKNKSENAKIVAVILNVAGIAVCVAGTAMIAYGVIDKATNSGAGTYDENDNFIPSDYNKDNTIINNGIIVTGAGVVLGIGSAVLYTRSSILYYKAREIKMTMNTNSINIPVTGARSFHAPQIGLGFSISL